MGDSNEYILLVAKLYTFLYIFWLEILFGDESVWRNYVSQLFMANIIKNILILRIIKLCLIEIKDFKVKVNFKIEVSCKNFED